MRPGERETCLRVLRENLADVDTRLTGAFAVIGTDPIRAMRQALYEHRGAIEKAMHVLERGGGAS